MNYQALLRITSYNVCYTKLLRLNYLWDYGEGNLAAVKLQLEQSLGLFDRCFMRAEVEGFLEMLTPENLSKAHQVQDFIKRLATFKHLLKESHREGLIELYDFLLLRNNFV